MAVVLAVSALTAGVASADILVMRSADGETFISNRGQRKGWKVVRRMKEFPGSSGLGLKGLKGSDAGQYDALIREAAESVDLDPHLVKAVVRAESNFQPRATSPKGAMGLMQLMP
ncbi:MAG: transglycosylase SLT domain-containing protein, partial [Candidatus Binatia bacterium]